MNLVLWGAQIVLAIKLLTAAYTHAIRPDPEKMRRGTERLGAGARPVLAAVALCTFLAAAGLILPAATGVSVWLTPWFAALAALLMLASIGFHLACRDQPKVWVGTVLLALAAFVAYGRWVLAPL